MNIDLEIILDEVKDSLADIEGYLQDWHCNSCEKKIIDHVEEFICEDCHEKQKDHLYNTNLLTIRNYYLADAARIKNGAEAENNKKCYTKDYLCPWCNALLEVEYIQNGDYLVKCPCRITLIDGYHQNYEYALEQCTTNTMSSKEGEK